MHDEPLAKETVKRSAKVLQCAIEIFAREGFAQTDVQKIADAAGVGKGTVYRHFGSKEELFLAAARHVRNEVLAEADAHADQQTVPLERLRSGVKAYVGYFQRQPLLVELLIQERAHFPDRTPTFFDDSDHRTDHWVELFQQLVADGVIRNLPLPQIRAAISHYVFGALFVRYLAGAEFQEQEEQSIFEVFLCGLLTPESQRRA